MLHLRTNCRKSSGATSVRTITQAVRHFAWGGRANGNQLVPQAEAPRAKKSVGATGLAKVQGLGCSVQGLGARAHRGPGPRGPRVVLLKSRRCGGLEGSGHGIPPLPPPPHPPVFALSVTETPTRPPRSADYYYGDHPKTGTPNFGKCPSPKL